MFQETPFPGEGIVLSVLLGGSILSGSWLLKRAVHSESPGLPGPSSRHLDRGLRRITETDHHAVVDIHQADRDGWIDELALP